MMKKVFPVLLATVVLTLLAGCAAGITGPAGTPAPTAKSGTPAPGGQINVPGVSIQVYAPGPNPLAGTADSHGTAAGIALGIWHGIISPVTLVVSFFNPGVQTYEVHNDGTQYNLGFLLGTALVFVLLGVLGGSKRR